MPTVREKVLQALQPVTPLLAQARASVADGDASPLGDLLTYVLGGSHLDAESARQAVREMMSDGPSDALRAAFLCALQAKGETEEEIAAFADVMRGLAAPLGLDPATPLVDTCGTGADGASTFNVSTCIIFILAACGLKVAKHGNRAITSKCGSADLLEALGAKIDLEPAQVKRSIEQVGVGFLFAPKFHSATRMVMAARKELASIGQKTVFNILGPLTNPARPGAQLLGVFRKDFTRTMAHVLRKLGTKRALVVWGSVGPDRGVDEVSIVGTTFGAELREGGEVIDMTIQPGTLGVNSATLEDIQGGAPEHNKQLLMTLFERGEPAALKRFTALNAAAALYASGRVADLREGLTLAFETLSDGSALRKVRDYVEVTHHA